MRKVYRLENLCCANCARKMEEAIQKIEGVTYGKITFMTMKLTLEADDASFDGVFKEVVRVCRAIEPDCEIVQ